RRERQEAVPRCVCGGEGRCAERVDLEVRAGIRKAVLKGAPGRDPAGGAGETRKWLKCRAFPDGPAVAEDPITQQHGAANAGPSERCRFQCSRRSSSSPPSVPLLSLSA